MRGANPHVTVLRDGDIFTYKHQVDKEATIVSIRSIWGTSMECIELNETVLDAIGFLADSFNSAGNSGKGLDEAQCHGAAALCESIKSMIIKELEDRYSEIEIIKKLAANEVPSKSEV
jgi:hypothetical protein